MTKPASLSGKKINWIVLDSVSQMRQMSKKEEYFWKKNDALKKAKFAECYGGYTEWLENEACKPNMLDRQLQSNPS